jgi:hypothetical protein
MRRAFMAAFLSIVVIPAALSAQPQNPQQARRQQLEQAVQQRLLRLMKEQVGLTDAQITRVQEVNRRIELQRATLLIEERQARQALRDEVTLGDSTRNPVIAQLMDRMFKAISQRMTLNQQEQAELAQFMTPMQRAKYYGIKEVIQRRVNQMLQQQAAAGDSTGAPGQGRGRGGRGGAQLQGARRRALADSSAAKP